MARLWSCGFELQSATAGMEFSNAANTPAISTAIKRSGAASLECSGSLGTGLSRYAGQQFAGDATGITTVYVRAAIYIDSLDGSAAGLAVMDLYNSVGTNTCSVGVYETGGVRRLFCAYNSQANTLFDMDATSFISYDTWHVIEFKWVAGAVGNGQLDVRVDGVSKGSTTTASISVTNVNLVTFGIYNNSAGSITGTKVHYDDIAINDSTGSAQNSWPGNTGKIVHLHPNAAGDNNTWQTSGGGAGSATNVQAMDETPTPDDVTTYLKRIATTIKVDDYNLPASSTAGINSGDTITLVQVGLRGGAISTTPSTARDVLLRLKSAASGTVSKSASSTNRLHVNGWTTHSATNPKNYQLTSYTDPTTGVAWTPTGTNSLDNMQVGVENQTSSTTEVRISAIWALIEYVVVAASAALTGTATASITETDIVSGGKTVILTLTNETWVASGATFDAQRQNIINGLDSAQAEGTGWDAEVKAKLAVTDVARTSDTVVTITLSAQAAYNITATETITATIPGTALTAGNALVATPTFTVAPTGLAAPWKLLLLGVG